MSQNTLCDAIQTKNLVQFYYKETDNPGYRTVEPHMVADNPNNHRALSAWYLRGASESGEEPYWREYLLSEIIQVTVLEQEFSGPRPGYDPTGGERFHNVQCAL